MATPDIHQHVTDTIVAAIEAGTPPWRQPWTGGATGAMLPLRHNGKEYRGINILILWAEAHAKGYNSARWMTFKQAKDLGGMVRKGEKCARSVFYGTFEKDDEQGPEGEAKRIPYAKCNNVFNADQIDGLPEEYYIRPNPPRDLGTKSDPEIDAFFARTGAKIVTSDDPRAYYKPATDEIHMPPVSTFYTPQGYYSTLAHELAHWTGGSARLDRIKRFQKREDYAFEELVAEIANCFICLRLGITPEFDQTAAYVEGWLKALKDDKGMIFKAASEAQKAVDYLFPEAEEQKQAQAA